MPFDSVVTYAVHIERNVMSEKASGIVQSLLLTPAVVLPPVLGATPHRWLTSLSTLREGDDADADKASSSSSPSTTAVSSNWSFNASSPLLLALLSRLDQSYFTIPELILSLPTITGPIQTLYRTLYFPLAPSIRTFYSGHQRTLLVHAMAALLRPSLVAAPGTLVALTETVDSSFAAFSLIPGECASHNNVAIPIRPEEEHYLHFGSTDVEYMMVAFSRTTDASWAARFYADDTGSSLVRDINRASWDPNEDVPPVTPFVVP
jgi:hypothetical protein